MGVRQGAGSRSAPGIARIAEWGFPFGLGLPCRGRGLGSATCVILASQVGGTRRLVTAMDTAKPRVQMGAAHGAMKRRKGTVTPWAHLQGVVRLVLGAGSGAPGVCRWTGCPRRPSTDEPA